MLDMSACGGLRVLCLCCVLILNALCGETTAKPGLDESDWKEASTRTASQCFHVRGVPVVNLRCPPASLIRVLHAFYGVRTDTGSDVSPACSYDVRSGDCVQEMSLKENCMGKTVCTLPVSNPFLSTCEQYASYMQVNYTCVPRERIRDICAPAQVTTWQGYISSPRYPAPYPPDVQCACSLKTQDSSILLTILDFSLHTSGRADGRCPGDRLRIDGWGDKCNPVVPEGLPETLRLRRQALTLRLETDGLRQDRGFWLEFRGSNGGKVTMTCGQRVSPPATEANLTPTRRGQDAGVWLLASTDNESTSELEETTDNNVVLVDDSDTFRPTRPRGTPTEEINNEFETYDFSDQAEYQLYNVGSVQLATGIVVSVLILVAVVIIIVLVFRR